MVAQEKYSPQPESSGGSYLDAAEEDYFEFHHVQVFADALLPLSEYKALEARLNELAHKGHFDPFSGGMRFLGPQAHLGRVLEGQRVWDSLSKCGAGEAQQDRPTYVPHGQDLAEQLVVGLGWRVTAEHVGGGTRTLLVTSSDPCGVKLCITAPHGDDVPCSSSASSADCVEEMYDHFSLWHVERFKASHSGRQVLCPTTASYRDAVAVLLTATSRPAV